MARSGRNNSDEKVKLKKGAYKRAARVFRYIKPYRFTFAIGMLFLVLSSITTMGFPYLIGELFGTTANPTSSSFDLKDLSNINVVVVLLFMVFAANAVFSFFRIYLFNIVTESALKDLRDDAFKQMVFLPVSYYDKSKVGELSSRIATDINLLQEMLTTTLAEFIRQWITVFISISVIAFISIRLSLIMLAVVPVVAIIAVIFGKFIKKVSREAQDSAAESNTTLQEVLSAIKSVKAFANESVELARFGRSTSQIKKLSIKGSVYRGLFASFIIFGMFGAVTVVIWQGMNMVHTGDLSIENFTKFILFTIFLGASFGGISSMFGTIQKSVGATERLMDILELPTEPKQEDIELKHILKGDVVFSDVHFHYETRKDIEVIKGLDFTVNAGQTVAIVGPSGAGKSTITSLLLRYYEPTQGKILFDDVSSSEFDLRELRSQMAIVPQEVQLFGGTIKENIAYGKPGATLEEIEEAAAKANALSFIKDFPEGFDTTVGDRGIQLSGGQKQRIAIARAVLKDPKILILDEATSSLDTESEKLVQDALDKLMVGRTSFVIAHRLSTIKNADVILVLEHGKLAEQGTHVELIEKEGVYAKLNAIQFKDEVKAKV